MLLKAKFLVKVLTVKGSLKYLGYIVTQWTEITVNRNTYK